MIMRAADEPLWCHLVTTTSGRVDEMWQRMRVAMPMEMEMEMEMEMADYWIIVVIYEDGGDANTTPF